MHTDANMHAYATLSIIYYYKTYNYNNRSCVVLSFLVYVYVLVLAFVLSFVISYYLVLLCVMLCCKG